MIEAFGNKIGVDFLEYDVYLGNYYRLASESPLAKPPLEYRNSLLSVKTDSGTTTIPYANFESIGTSVKKNEIFQKVQSFALESETSFSQESPPNTTFILSTVGSFVVKHVLSTYSKIRLAITSLLVVLALLSFTRQLFQFAIKGPKQFLFD